MMVASIQPLDHLAIIGMDAAWAGCDSLDAFEQRVSEAGVWAPAGFENGQSALAAAGEPLLNKVAAGALLNAGISPEGPALRIAVLLAGSLAGLPRWPWAAFAADLNREPNALAAGLANAQRLFESRQADVVVIAAGSALTAVPAGAPLASSAGYGFDREVHGWRFGEGAGAVVVMQAARARAEGRRIYAVVRALAYSPGSGGAEDPAALPTPPAVDDVRACCRAALEHAGILPQQVGYVETFACGVDALDGVEIAGMVQAYRQPDQDLSAAIGSAQASTGYMGPASGVAGLVRAALCLYHRYIPAAPGWTGPKLPALWRGAPFYVAGDTRTWFAVENGAGRAAGLNVVGRGGSFAHLILTEPADQPVRISSALQRGGFLLFPLVAGSTEAMLAELEELRRALTFATDRNALAAEWFQAAAAQPHQRLGLAIVGHNHEELDREITLALQAIPAAAAKETEWQTPLGSYFTPAPVGRLGGIALVYPGAFNSYPGVGRDLFRLFPELHQRAASVTRDMGRIMHERLLYPRSLAAISKEEISALEAALIADPIAMLNSGAALAVLYTHILQGPFGLRPQAAFGYSLGENSMLFATGVWAQGDAASERLAASDVFRVRLAGPQAAIREYWGLPQANDAQPGDQPLWSNYLVMATPEQVRQALESEQRVYLTHINTPRQVVIGGDPEGCRRVIAALRCSSLQAPFAYALHCDPMRSEYTALVELHNWPVEQTPDIRLYSAADYGPLALEQEEIAHKIGHMLTTPLDFPRLIERVYADGARIFIEAGAGSNCARWIDETLKDRPHLALSMNRRGTDDYTTLVRTMARLHAHRVPVNLAPLYQGAYQAVNS